MTTSFTEDQQSTGIKAVLLHSAVRHLGHFRVTSRKKTCHAIYHTNCTQASLCLFDKIKHFKTCIWSETPEGQYRLAALSNKSEQFLLTIKHINKVTQMYCLRTIGNISIHIKMLTYKRIQRTYNFCFLICQRFIKKNFLHTQSIS